MLGGWRNSAGCGLIAVALLTLGGCNSLNPLCGSARPNPGIVSLSPGTVTLAQVQSGVTITVTGNNFVAATQAEINSALVETTVVNSTQLTLEVTSGTISAPGTLNISVHTAAGTTGDFTCSSGGTTGALALTVD